MKRQEWEDHIFDTHRARYEEMTGNVMYRCPGVGEEKCPAHFMHHRTDGIRNHLTYRPHQLKRGSDIIERVMTTVREQAAAEAEQLGQTYLAQMRAAKDVVDAAGRDGYEGVMDLDLYDELDVERAMEEAAADAPAGGAGGGATSASASSTLHEQLCILLL